MTFDHLLAIVSLLALSAFLGTLVVFVQEFDLVIFVIGGIVLAGYDFWRELRGLPDHGSGPKA